MIKYIIIALILCSCYTHKKAAIQHGKVVNTYRDIAAAWCAEEYPIVTKTDSTAYKNSKRVIDSLAAELARDSLLSESERERLITEINRIRASIPEPADCDSVSDAVYRLAAKEKQRGDKLQVAYTNLLAASQNIKPVRDTVVNYAAVDLCNIEKRAAILALSTEQKRADKYKATSRRYLWILIAIGAAMGVWLFFKLKGKK